VSSLEILAMSPALTGSNLEQFDAQISAFLDRLPPGTVAGITTRDQQIQRLYGPQNVPAGQLPRRAAGGQGLKVFDTGQPVITDIHAGPVSGELGFTVDVPVVRGGIVVYDLFIRLSPAVLEDLIVRQHMPPQYVLTVIDTAGMVVARLPKVSRFVGLPVVPALWTAIQARPEGVVQVPTLEGVPAVASFTHIAPFGWSVAVGAPEEVVFAPMRAAIIRVAEVGTVVLIAALLLAMMAAKGIIRPIEQLGRLATHDD
jgi:hypothetical protein